MRLLHTMIRTGDVDRTIAFYTGVLGMSLLRTTDRPEQRYTVAFVGCMRRARQQRDRTDLQLGR